MTGSSRGLGATIARGLGRAGAKIVLNGRDVEALRHARSSLQNEGIDAAMAAFDVANEGEVNDAIERVESDIGPIEILVNNAGITIRMNFVEVAMESWQQVLDTNLSGPLVVGKACAKKMIARGRGKIINICSLLSEATRIGNSAYASAKGGLRMLTKTMATELAVYNIQVNGIGPGYFATELTQPLADDPKFDVWLKARTPARRWGDPEELVGPAIFLASEASSFVNGQLLFVDGGMLATL